MNFSLGVLQLLNHVSTIKTLKWETKGEIVEEEELTGKSHSLKAIGIWLHPQIFGGWEGE